MKPFVSVIAPVYNNAGGILKLLEALKNQDYPQDNFEVIIVDNGSIDDTVTNIQSFSTKLGNFKLLIEANIRGSYAARNKGIEAARGTILAFTDSDCIPDKHWVSSGINGLLENQAKCAGGTINHIYSKKSPSLHEKFDTSNRLNQKYYIENMRFAATANLFIYKNLIINIGMFNINLLSSGDLEFGQRLKKTGNQIIFISNAIVNHPARNTLLANIKKSIRLAVGQNQMNMLKNSTNTSAIKFRNENSLIRNLSMFDIVKVLLVDAINYLKIIKKRIF